MLQARYDDAKLLFEKAHLRQKEVLGAEHPLTLLTRLRLASLSYSQARYPQAISLYEKTLPLLAKVLGYEHPEVREAYIKYAECLVNLGHHKKAVEVLKMIEPIQLFYAKGQFYTTEKERVRRVLFINLAAYFQSVVFTLVHRYQSENDMTHFAAEVLLRWKQLQTEEEVLIAKLMHHAENKQIADLIKKIKQQRTQLSHQIYQVDKTESLSQLGEQLEAAELKLAQSSPNYEVYSKAINRLAQSSPNYKAHSNAIKRTREKMKKAELQLAELSSHYKSHLKVMETDIEQIRAVLPPNSALIEFRLYMPVDFSNKIDWVGTRHWTALLLTQDKLLFKDLGPVAKTEAIWEQLTQPGSKEDARKLYQNLFGVFDEHIKGLDTVYIAPDDFINLIPFSRLVLPDGRYWIERQTLRQIQTGRDLLREKPTPSSNGLLAIGNVNFDAFPKQRRPQPKRQNSETIENHRGLVKKKLRFKRLKHSRSEIKQIKENYPTPSEMWTGKNASEGRLKGLTQVPRVLHLATHAFYLDNSSGDVDIVRPLTLSGIALAGANRGLKGKLDPDGEDGILYSLEALNLNLTGTELVVFSACETGKGVIDYSEGVYGLVRAFKIAGAYRLLMTLWKVKDKASKDFMLTFYNNWLNQYPDDPAKALRITQLYYINHPSEEKWRDPKVWAAYVLVGP